MYDLPYIIKKAKRNCLNTYVFNHIIVAGEEKEEE
jgi:hypothetical protein